jgi:predicted nuclease of restriction endonuclease-like (RecB) superfamily
VVLLEQTKDPLQRLWYASKTIEFGWSRVVLVHQIESGAYSRQGKALTNFKATLPASQSDLARQMIKDPYHFDFLTLTEDYNERVLETALTDEIQKFLLELGAGFAFMGRQVPLTVGAKNYFLDLLFYHVKLHCYVIVELKTTDFEPEHAGKLNFYIKAVDNQLKTLSDQPTIGIIICKNREKVAVEYALSDIYKPIGVSEYKLTHSLPKNLKSSLPTIEAFENELSGRRGRVVK